MFTKFRKLNLLVEKQGECAIKRLKTDGGREYTSTELAHFYEKEGIEREFIPVYIPEHNNITERKDKSALNLEIRMLKEKQMPNHI